MASLSTDVFERRTSIGSEPFSLFICRDANKFVLLSFFSLMKRICLRDSTKPLPNDAKGLLPVDVRRSKTRLLKFPNDGRKRPGILNKTILAFPEPFSLLSGKKLLFHRIFYCYC